MADYDRRLTIACVISAILGIAAFAIGVLFIVMGFFVNDNSESIIAELYKMMVPSTVVSQFGVVNYMIFAVGVILLLLAIMLILTAVFTRRREKYGVGLILLCTVFIVSLIPVFFSYPGLVIVTVLVGITIWLFGSSQYEFY